MDPVCHTLTCGICRGDQRCESTGRCECLHEECSGECCSRGAVCSTDDGRCCEPDCGASECGWDPVCGALDCGDCGPGAECGAGGLCQCSPGHDECSGECCGADEVCSLAGFCCTPDCRGRACGMDPECGAESCGVCGMYSSCNGVGSCECSSLDCDGVCCGPGEVCTDVGAFRVCCVPDCTGLECGPDHACGSECGPCPSGYFCSFGTCIS